MRFTKSGLIAGTAIATLMLLPALSFAQASEETVDSNTIIVTAQKRSQSIDQVPTSIFAIGNEKLERLGITKFDELAAYTPGIRVQEQSANNSGFVVRGITTDSGSAFDEPRVAIFQDGVSASRNRGAYTELFDLERVEIVKGPQPTLFGRSAMIGGINVIQNKANVHEKQGILEVGAGEDNYFRTMAVYNLPLITDTLAVRIGGTYRQRDGWTENLLGGDKLQGVEATAFRGVLSYRPSEDTKFDLIYNFHHDNNSGTAFKSGTFIPNGGDISPYSPAALNISFPNFEGGKDIGLDRTVSSATAIFEKRLNDQFTLTSLTGFREFNSLELFDPDGSAINIMQGSEDAKGTQWSQEFRVNFKNNGPLEGFAGVSYINEKNSTRFGSQLDEHYLTALLSGALITTPTRSTPSALETQIIGTGFLQAAGIPAAYAGMLYSSMKTEQREQSTNYSQATSYDVFADATWHINDKWDLTGGLRYTYDNKKSGLDAELLNGPSRLGNLLVASTMIANGTALVKAGQTTAGMAYINQGNGLINSLLTGGPLLNYGALTQPTDLVQKRDTFDGFAGRLVTRYQFNKNASLWTSYSRGRRPEVIAINYGNLPGTTVSVKELPSETVDSIEIGGNLRTFDGKLKLNGSVYYYKYKNFQTQSYENGQLVTINAGKANAPGAEIAAELRPIDNLEFFATYAYSKARFDGGAYDGNHFRLSPDNSAALGATWTIPLSGKGRILVTPSYTWQSKTYFDDNNDLSSLQPPLLPTAPTLRDRAEDEFQDAYGLFNLRAKYESQNTNWSFEVFANNLTDEEYLLDAGNVGDSLTIPTFIRGAPRMIGANISLKF